MTGDADLIERTIDSELVFDGVLLKVHRDTVALPNGGAGVREWIAHPGAVVVIAMLDNGKLLFERQFRYPVQRVCLEFPAEDEEEIFMLSFGALCKLDLMTESGKYVRQKVPFADGSLVNCIVHRKHAQPFDDTLKSVKDCASCAD